MYVCVSLCISVYLYISLCISVISIMNTRFLKLTDFLVSLRVEIFTKLKLFFPTNRRFKILHLLDKY